MDLDDEELEETKVMINTSIRDYYDEQIKDRICVLGTTYKVEKHSFTEDKKLETLDGYTDHLLKLIVIEDNFEDRNMLQEKIEKYQNKVLRHEIIHAFLYESGLDCNTNKIKGWAENEEMVDWFAIQSPKIFEIYKQLNIL